MIPIKNKRNLLLGNVRLAIGHLRNKQEERFSHVARSKLNTFLKKQDVRFSLKEK